MMTNLMNLPMDKWLAATVKAWQNHAYCSKEPRKAFRLFDPDTPYGVHPMVAAGLLAQEPLLPRWIRELGFQALMHHDGIEDTVDGLPPDTPSDVVDAVKLMSFSGGSKEEFAKLPFLPVLIQLFKIYDKLSNICDGVTLKGWMTSRGPDDVSEYLEKSLELAERVHGSMKELCPEAPDGAVLNGVLFMRAICAQYIEPRSRYSGGGLGLQVWNVDTGELRYCGMLNPGALRNGKFLLTPPGGAALLTAEGQKLMEAFKPVYEKEPEAGGRDARVRVRKCWHEQVLNILESGDASVIETSIDRELKEELCRIEMPSVQTSPVLEPDDFAEVNIEPLGLYRQPQPDDGVGTSSNAQVGMPTYRAFYLHRINVSARIWAKFEAAFPVIVLLTEDEVASTNGGRKKGKIVRNGKEFTVGDNMFVYPPRS